MYYFFSIIMQTKENKNKCKMKKQLKMEMKKKEENLKLLYIQQYVDENWKSIFLRKLKIYFDKGLKI